jgi:hypothetical protein
MIKAKEKSFERLILEYGNAKERFGQNPSSDNQAFVAAACDALVNALRRAGIPIARS